MPHGDHLTARQVALWEYLAGLPAGDATLRVPTEIRGPSAAARTALGKEGERFKLAADHASLAADYREALARLVEAEEQFWAAHNAGVAAARGEERRARELERVEDSISWRVTAPLRRAIRTLRSD